MVEKAILSDPSRPGTILRLPDVYGPGTNAGLSTIYSFRNHSEWRWTHGHVENVAAVAPAVVRTEASGRIYNVGEEYTPSVRECLERLPELKVETGAPEDEAQFEQDVVYDSTRIRRELDYREIVSYEEGLRRTFAASRRARRARASVGILPLPATAAVTTTTTAVAAATATTAAAPATASGATSATTARAASAAKATTGGARRARFIYDQSPPQKILAVARLDGLLGIIVVADFSEAETSGFSGILIAHHADGIERYASLLAHP